MTHLLHCGVGFLKGDHHLQKALDLSGVVDQTGVKVDRGIGFGLVVPHVGEAVWSAVIKTII